MDREKRKGTITIPDNLQEMLNEVQRQSLPGIKCLGWEPRFLRKPLFMAPELVMYNSNDGRSGILDENGRLIIKTNIRVREQESHTQTPPPLNNLYYYW
jgi:hypothetical protein